MLDAHVLGLVVLHKVAHIVLVGIIPVDARHRGVAHAGPLEIGAVAAAPLPGIVEIEHSLHAAALELDKQAVEPGEKRVVVDAWCGLQHGSHVGRHAQAAIGTHQDAQVVDAQLLQAVEFLAEALPVASLAIAGKNGGIPEVGAHIAIGLALHIELAVAHAHILALASGRGLACNSTHNQAHEEEKSFGQMVHFLIIMIIKEPGRRQPGGKACAAKSTGW